MGSGGNFAQLMFAKETTYGTLETPNTAVEFVSESLKQEIKRIESAGLRARRLMHSSQWVPGAKRVVGDVEVELRDSGFGKLLEACFGGVATAGAGPYTHTFTPDALPSLTVQVGRPRQNGTVQPFTYTGCKVNQWTLACAVDEIVKLTMSLVGQAEDTAEALGTPSYPTGDLLTFVGGSLSVAAGQIDVTEAELTAENSLRDERWYMRGNAAIKEPDEGNGLRNITGSFLADFEDLTQYNRYVNGDEAALELTFADAGGTHSLVITTNVRFDGETPEVSGAEALNQPVPFKVVASGADSTGITAVLTTADATP